MLNTISILMVLGMLNPYTAMGDYSCPKLTKRSLLWATIVAEKFFKKKKKKKIFFEKYFFAFFFHFRFVVPFYMRFKYS